MGNQDLKGDSELDFWINVWNKKIIDTGCWTEDVYDLIGEKKKIESYDKQREKEAKAQGYRILGLAQKPRDYFENKIVVEIGPGCCGLLEMSNARVKIAVEPLAEKYRNSNLLLKNENGAVYLTCGSEQMPIMSNYTDIVIASNCLDHVDDIKKSISEIHRITKPGGELFLNIEIDHPVSVCEPYSLTSDDVRDLFGIFECIFSRTDTNPDGRKWIRAVYRKKAPK